MLRDTLVGLIEPMLRGAGVHCSRAGFSPCCSRHRTIDPQCLENPRPAGAESTLTENARSPFHAEPRHSGHGIVCEHDLPQRTWRSVERSIAFHRHNPVRDNEVDRNGCAQIENALLNAFPVENILRPSVSRARHYTKHVF